MSSNTIALNSQETISVVLQIITFNLYGQLSVQELGPREQQFRLIYVLNTSRLSRFLTLCVCMSSRGVTSIKSYDRWAGHITVAEKAG